MKLTPQQWMSVIAVLAIMNLVVFGALIWLVVTDLASFSPGLMEEELSAGPTLVARVAPTLRPTFTSTPGAVQPLPAETPVPSSTPAPAPTAMATGIPTSILLPTDTLTPVATAAPTDTSTPVPIPTLTPTGTPTLTLTPASTASPTATSTTTRTPTGTPTLTLTPASTTTWTPTSTPTDTVTPTPHPTVAPPAGVRVLSVSNDRIDLSWKPASGPASLSYRIYWDMGLGMGLYTYKASVRGTRYSSLNLRPGTSYRYLVVAYDGNRESSACAVVATTRPERVALVPPGPAQAPQPWPGQQPTPTPSPTATPSPTSTPSRVPTPSPTRRPTASSTPPPRPSPAWRQTGAAPTPLPPDTVLLGLISSHDYEDDLGFFTIVGEVRNDLPLNAGKTLVTVTFYNASGDVIEEVATSTMLDILLPGQRSPFALTLPKPAGLWEYSLRITARPTLEQPLAGLEVVYSRADEDDAGFYHVRGEVENTGSRTAERVQIIVTLYDRWGKIINAGFVYSEPQSIRPGEKAAFDCSFNYYPLVKEYLIQVERD